MTKYLLDFECGQKGDFLCNFLNGKKLRIENNFNKSFPDDINLKLLDSLIKKGKEEILKNTLSKDFLICAGHNLDIIDDNILDQYNCKIIKLITEEKFAQTSLIECIIKHNTASTNVISNMRYGDGDAKENFKLYKKIKYHIDTILIEENIEITDSNRCLRIIKMIHDKKFDFLRSSTVNKNVWNIINYGDIYVNKNFDMLYEICPTFDEKYFLECLEKTWLPNKINLFGKIVDLRDYGYRDY